MWSLFNHSCASGNSFLSLILHGVAQNCLECTPAAPLGCFSFSCLHWVSNPIPPCLSSLYLPHCYLFCMTCWNKITEFTGCCTQSGSLGFPFRAVGKNLRLPARPLRVRQARPAQQASPPSSGAARWDDNSFPETHCLKKLQVIYQSAELLYSVRKFSQQHKSYS